MENAVPHPLYISATEWTALQHAPAFDFLDQLAQPLHQELYEAQSFSVIQHWPPMQQLLLCLDYVNMHALQGGWLQVFHNGYAELVAIMSELLAENQYPDESALADKALAMLVPAYQNITAESSPENFAGLYATFPEFEPLSAAWNEAWPALAEKLKQQIIGMPLQAGLIISAEG